MSIVLGIDPGWASCGLSLYVDGKTEWYDNFVPRDLCLGGSYRGAIDFITTSVETMDRRVNELDAVYMERYVAYKGIQSDTSEAILMFIGALKGYFNYVGVNVKMVRAIDWKPAVCKYLVRTVGFNNPHSSFDKKYSILAANTLSGAGVKSDHAADAICLSYLGQIEEYNNANGKGKK